MASAKGKNSRKGLSGQALKDFRHSVAILKQKGIVTKRVDARSQIDTRYMRDKVRKFNDVIEGRAVVLKAKPEVVRKYRATKSLPTANGKIVVPLNHPLQKVRVEKRGFVEVVTPLKNGESAEVILPIEAAGLRSFMQKMIAERDDIDALKDPGEYFSFRVGENNSRESFANTDEMVEYLQKYYDRAQRPITTRKEVKELFTFQRFKTANGTYPEDGRNPTESGKPKKAYPEIDAQGRNRDKGKSVQRKRVLAAKKARQRANETPEARTRRLASNARREAQRRQRIFEGY